MLILEIDEWGEAYIDGGRVVVRSLPPKRPGRVRLGFIADASIPIDRAEVHFAKLASVARATAMEGCAA